MSLSGLNQNTEYTLQINFSCYTNTFDATSAMYLAYSNSNGSYNGSTYKQNRPAAQIGNISVYGTNNDETSQFSIVDTVTFTADTNGSLYVDLYAGTNNPNGWSGNYYWSFSTFAVAP